MMTKIFNREYMNIGIGTTPFNAWLLIRGLRTIKIRLEKISDTTPKIVGYLKKHEKVESVIFPFDKDFPQYELAKQQMEGACGLFSFTIKAKTIKEVENYQRDKKGHVVKKNDHLCDSLRYVMMSGRDIATQEPVGQSGNNRSGQVSAQYRNQFK